MLTDKRRVQRGVLAATLLVCLWQGAAGLLAVRGRNLPAERGLKSTPLPALSRLPAASVEPLLGVDLNRATREELALLPGIGPVASARIMDDRRRRGPFRQVDALQRVHGIGPKTVQAIRPYLLPSQEAAPPRVARQPPPPPGMSPGKSPPASQSEVVSPGKGMRQYDGLRK